MSALLTFIAPLSSGVFANLTRLTLIFQTRALAAPKSLFSLLKYGAIVHEGIPPHATREYASLVQLDNLIGSPSHGGEGGVRPINHLIGVFCAMNGLWHPHFDLRARNGEGL